MLFIIIGGTTFFVIFAICRSRFAKEVGKRIVDHRRAKRRQIIQRALQELPRHARMFKEHKSKCLDLQSKSKRLVGLLWQNNDVSLKAARNLRDSERIECKRLWNILEEHGELPIDPDTKERWRDFDNFLERVNELEEVCA